ncbi:MAG TPA: DNA cytosine methyltransferase, partial [Desulfomonilaceae bacterium]|nr:DNA cytosine methyltransferase [Desulfomonilaceae bacterium]
MGTVDLFSGCARISLGFELSGFQILLALDNWDAAVKCYRASFNYPVLKRDLTVIGSVAAEIQEYR